MEIFLPNAPWKATFLRLAAHLLVSFINAVLRDPTIVTPPEEGLWDRGRLNMNVKEWPTRHVRAFVFSLVDIDEDDEVV